MSRSDGGGVAPGVPDAGTPPVEISPFGDAALLVSLGDRPDASLTARAHEIAAVVEGLRGTEPAFGRPLPAHASVLVPLDALALSREVAIERLRKAVRDAIATRPEDGGNDVNDRVVEIVVRYGGEDGPDLADVASRAGLSEDAVVELHATARYRVLFLGFAPGFAYLGGLPDELVMPRRTTPRERVPAGSVAIAGAFAGVYPLAMPGGWNLIGRTDAVLFDPIADPPARLRPRSTVRFVPVS
jgi:KipI family sensor histidine kinase inhibitor